MDMPGYLDYQKMAMQDPMAYGQSIHRLGLAKLFQAEKQKQAESKTLADTMANDQSQQMNPLLVQQQRLVNTGKDTSNQEAGLTLKRNKAVHSYNLDADQRAAILKIGEDQLKTAQQKIDLDYASGDPVRIERAKHGEQWLSTVRAEKRKNDAKMEKERYKQMQETGRATERNATTLEAQRIAGQSRTDVAGMKGANKGVTDIKQAVLSGKMSPANAAVAFHGAAMTAADPEDRALYAQMASDYETLAKQMPAAGNAGKIDTPAVAGLPAVQQPSAFNGGQPPAPTPKLSAPAGRTAIYKGGKAFSVPDNQVKDALAQGYTIK